MVLLIQIKVTDFSILLIFKFKQYKNAIIANFVSIYCGKTLDAKRYVLDNNTHSRGPL